MPDRRDLIDVVLVGCGAMGRHHARVVSEHPDCRLVAVVDTDRGAAERVAAAYGGLALERAPLLGDVAIVATPASTHVDVALPLLRAGCRALVEKPLAESAERGRELDDPDVAVGLVERLNPALAAVEGPTVRHLQVARCAPASARGRDVDVLLDLAQHDLDLLRVWSGSEPVATAGSGSADRVEVSLRAGGVEAECLWDRSAASAMRRLVVRDGGGTREVDLLGASRNRAGGRDPLERQWDAVVRWVRGDGAPVANAADGLAAVRAATALRLALCAVGVAACDPIQRTWDGVYEVDAFTRAAPCDAVPAGLDFGGSHIEVDLGGGDPRVFAVYMCDDPACGVRTTRWYGAVASVDERALEGFLSTTLWTSLGSVDSCSSTLGEFSAARTSAGRLTIDLASRSEAATGLDTASCFELAGELTESAECAAIEHLEARSVAR